jgi:hypothetical protein
MSAQCEWCNEAIPATRKEVAKTCSPECQKQRYDLRKRERARANRIPAEKLPSRKCKWCKQSFIPYRNNTVHCSRKCSWRAAKTKDRPEHRECYKCKAPVAWKVGVPCCENCRVETVRKNQQINDRRRTLRAYGITQEDYDAMSKSQNNRCAICGTDDPWRGMRRNRGNYWSIDHCHTTNRVRGLLCSACNLALGQFLDDPVILRSAADYLERATV